MHQPEACGVDISWVDGHVACYGGYFWMFDGADYQCAEMGGAERVMITIVPFSFDKTGVHCPLCMCIAL